MPNLPAKYDRFIKFGYYLIKKLNLQDHQEDEFLKTLCIMESNELQQQFVQDFFDTSEQINAEVKSLLRTKAALEKPKKERVQRKSKVVKPVVDNDNTQGSGAYIITNRMHKIVKKKKTISVEELCIQEYIHSLNLQSHIDNIETEILGQPVADEMVAEQVPTIVPESTYVSMVKITPVSQSVSIPVSASLPIKVAAAAATEPTLPVPTVKVARVSSSEHIYVPMTKVVPVSVPVSTVKEERVSVPISTVKEAQVSVPVSTVKEAPVYVPVSTAKTAHVLTVKEAPVSVPVSTVEAPHVLTVKEAPVSVPVSTAKEEPVSVPVSTVKEAQVSVPVEAAPAPTVEVAPPAPVPTIRNYPIAGGGNRPYVPKLDSCIEKESKEQVPSVSKKKASIATSTPTPYDEIEDARESGRKKYRAQEAVENICAKYLVSDTLMKDPVFAAAYRAQGEEYERKQKANEVVSDEDELVVSVFEWKGEKYLIDDSNTVYDFTTHDIIGKWQGTEIVLLSTKADASRCEAADVDVEIFVYDDKKYLIDDSNILYDFDTHDEIGVFERGTIVLKHSKGGH
jgi:hypothetical protein